MIEQLKAEAFVLQSLYHSLLMVQYALHPNVDGGATPGIGYRDNTNPALLNVKMSIIHFQE